MKKVKFVIPVSLLVLISACYTYNIPSGANTPLITEQGECKISVGANFTEAGGNFTYALTEHAVFTSSGSVLFSRNRYKQDYDSMLYKKTPNNFEVGFGYYGGFKKFANMLLFGIGTGHETYDRPAKYNNYNGYTEGYYQSDFVQYYLQYSAGFKFQKQKRSRIKYKEHGLSLRYAYHDFHISGISTDYIHEEVWNEAEEYYDFIEYERTLRAEEINHFNSFSYYYFYRTGNDKIQFEVSQGFSFYDNEPAYEKFFAWTPNMHFTVGLVFNLNNIIKH